MYAIAFDMDIATLKKTYGEPYNNAYAEISKGHKEVFISQIQKMMV